MKITIIVHFCFTVLLIIQGILPITPLKPGYNVASALLIAADKVLFFHQTCSIGNGDFGEVWKGDLDSPNGHLAVAIRQVQGSKSTLFSLVSLHGAG